MEEMPLGHQLSNVMKPYLGLFTAIADQKDLPLERYYYVLYTIGLQKGEASQQQVAQLLEVDKVAMCRMTDYLVEKELVQREQNPQDRREYLLHLTDAGKSLMPRISEVIQQANELALNGISVEEKMLLGNLLGRIKDNLEKIPAKNPVFLDFRNLKNEK